MVKLEDLAKKDYEIEYEGSKYKLKPTKVWKVQPKGRKGFVMALFRLPTGKVVRKVVAKVDEQGNIIT
ncbi:chromatin protein Cren7 [Vulcanisaeta sp. JCM 14467]|uniref:chromatin protein Cren7 n=1 Tax=Vulcanisaeta sp. JCM 14467 TaxID=1295370 RepID=UPI0006D2BDC4|nr:chromatin protein Cren7 [Vulcanisaeta sp. JCM 14467]